MIFLPFYSNNVSIVVIYYKDSSARLLEDFIINAIIINCEDFKEEKYYDNT